MTLLAATGTAAKGFPNGSVFVMENYAAAANPDGTLQPRRRWQAGQGRVAACSSRWARNPGWGQSAPEDKKNGDWIYAAYWATAARPGADSDLPRLPSSAVGQQNFVHRYDEFFAQK